MVVTNNTWNVWDNTGFLVGSGPVIVAKSPEGDRAIVDGQYLGGMGTNLRANEPLAVPTYLDTGRARVRFANHPDVVLRTRTHVQRVQQSLFPQLLGPAVASTGYASHFYLYHHGQLEPAAFRYTWYVNGQEIVASSNQDTFNHAFSVDGWHSVQVRYQFANDEEVWQTLQVYSMNCGGPNQCLRAAPEPPPNDLPDAQKLEDLRRVKGYAARQ
jgi:hypothetical protein